MSIRDYFRKLLAIQAGLAAEWVVLVSQETADGGQEGRFVEVSRETAAKMIAKGAARIASDLETRAHREQMQREAEQARAEAEASKLRLTVTTDRVERSHRPSVSPTPATKNTKE
jgi:hypothetical protein